MSSINRTYHYSVLQAIITGALILATAVACDNAQKKEKEEEPYQPIDIITETMDFQLVDTIQSGWQTFRYHNKSYETHFFLLDKYPPGKTIVDGEKEVMPPFQEGMDRINEGKPEEAGAAFAKLPAWFSEIVFLGGSGLVSPGKTSVTTLKMEPGYYVLECYVKMQNGMFHSVMGMVKELIVTADSTDQSAPTADIGVTISGKEGIVINGAVKKGKKTFSVFFKDQMVHENFVGHDVNLAKLDEKADLSRLEEWMDWSNPNGLITPAPEGVTFLGGVNDMPAGHTGYFTADLSPGNYVLISEVPNTSEKNMLITFTVTD